jgi:hypothetical protein
MKKGVVFLLFFFSLSAANAQTAGEVFLSFSKPILFPLSTNARLDLIDLFRAKKEAIIKNDFGDEVSLLQLTDDYVSIRSGNLQLEIILLSLINESKIICTIQTLCVSMCDSRLEFYTANWKELDSSVFIRPVDKLWFVSENDHLPILDISFMEFHYDNTKQSLTQTYNTPQYLSKEDLLSIKPYIREQTKEYKWNGMKFE